MCRVPASAKWGFSHSLGRAVEVAAAGLMGGGLLFPAARIANWGSALAQASTTSRGAGRVTGLIPAGGLSFGA